MSEPTAVAQRPLRVSPVSPEGAMASSLDQDPVRPEISVVIPICNEEAILERSVIDLTNGLCRRGSAFEVILAENGSNDATPEVVRRLQGHLSQVRALAHSDRNYGAALKQGILVARGEFVICDEIDLGDLDFYDRAMALLRGGTVHLVVGSKAAPGARDHRPAIRRVGTFTMSLLLRVFLGFRGTDTHGLKGFHRKSILPLIESCVADRDLFASELVVRSQQAGLVVAEIPVSVQEKRPPSKGLVRRVPGVMTNLWRLLLDMRLRRNR